MFAAVEHESRHRVDIRLSKIQSRIHRCQARHRVVVAGRRSGKSTYAKYACFLAAPDPNIRGDIRYVGPTLDQTREIVWEDLLKMFTDAGLKEAKWETTMRIRLKNGRIIRCYGAEEPGRLRGKGVGFMVLDEYADMNKKVWVAAEPSLADCDGRALFIGTPDGYTHFYDLYSEASLAMKQHSNLWAAFQFTTAEGGFVKPEIIAAARESLSARDFRQEYEASFEALGGRIYYGFDRDKNVQGWVCDNRGTLLVGMDFNVDPMTCTVSVRAGDECHTFNEFSINNSNTVEMAKALREEYPGRDIVVYPDPTGDSRHTNANLGETDITILRQHGLSVYIPTSGFYPIVDKYNTVNGMLCNANGRRRLLVNPKCKNLIKAWDGLCYKEGTKLPEKSGGLDHITDAQGYMICGAFPMVDPLAYDVQPLRI